MMPPSILRVAAALLLGVLASCSRPVEKDAIPAIPTPSPAAPTPVFLPHLVKPRPTTSPQQTPTPVIKKELGEALQSPEPSR